MEARQIRRQVFKHTIYTLLLVLCSVLQGTPGLLKWKAVHAMPVVAAVAVIAMAEGGFAGGLYGLFGGLLTDVWAFHIFGAASALFLVLGCVGGLWTLLMIHANRKTAFLLSCLFSLVYGSLSHYMIYGLWGYAGAGALFWKGVIPTALVTGLWGVVLFSVVNRVKRRFDE